MEYINAEERKEKAKESEIIKEILHDKGLVTKEELKAKKNKK